MDEFGVETAAVAGDGMVLDDGGGSTPTGDDLSLLATGALASL